MNAGEHSSQKKKRQAMMLHLKIGPAVKQYVIVIVANFTAFHLGMSVGWLSPVMVKLRADQQTVLPRPLTETEMAWILSISCLSSLSAFTYTSYIANKLGRKTSLILACIPRLVSCFFFIFATSYWMLLFGRALCGLSDYVAITLSAMYSSEIAGKKIRGGLGSVTQIMSSLGAMLMLSTGPFVSYHTINIILTCISFGTCLPVLFLPESPYFLYSKGRISEAEKLLTFLRGSEIEALDEIKEYSSQISVTIKESSLLKDTVVLKTVGKVIFLGISLQTIGTNAVTFYLQTIFESTNTSVRPEISSVVIGCIQLFACFCTILITDRFGRKPVLVVSLIGMAVGMIGLGTFFHLQSTGYTIAGWLNYLPLVSMILVIYCNNLGMGSLLWTLVAELFDGPARAMGVSIGVFFSIVAMFPINRYFASVSHALGPAATYWMFSASCAVTCLFIARLVPETKGLTFSQIQKDMGRTADADGPSC